MTSPTLLQPAGGQSLGITIKTTSRPSRTASSSSSSSSAAAVTTDRVFVSRNGSAVSHSQSQLRPADVDDIDWTAKYLTNDRPRSPRPSLNYSSRSPPDRSSPSDDTSITSLNGYNDFAAPVVSNTMRRTEQDLYLNWSGRRHVPMTSQHAAQRAVNGGGGTNWLRHQTATSSGAHLSPRTYSSNQERQLRAPSPAKSSPIVAPRSERGGSTSTGGYEYDKSTGTGLGSASSTQSTLTLMPNHQISQTRRKLRKLICQSKGDPHYYDF